MSRHSRSYGGLKKIGKYACPECGTEVWGVRGRENGFKCGKCGAEFSKPCI